ncbi:MAG: hypothetical protein ACU84Q_13910 [Gammaproteobacteria bacterium]
MQNSALGGDGPDADELDIVIYLARTLLIRFKKIYFIKASFG